MLEIQIIKELPVFCRSRMFTQEDGKCQLDSAKDSHGLRDAVILHVITIFYITLYISYIHK